MIEQATVERIKADADLYAVVSRHIDLTKSGNTWKGLCPFHTESSPSFTVTPSRSTWHCFGCGAHGDAIAFLQQHTGASFADAVQQLAGEMGIPVAKGQRVARPILKAQAKFTPPRQTTTAPVPLSDSLQQALQRWQHQLHQAEGYLSSRRIPLSLAQRMGLGFMGPGEDAAPGFRGPRVILPHTVPGGQVVNLYGRSTIANADKAVRHRHLSTPKAMFNAQALALDGPLWVTEGAFDALALMSAGVDKAVAIFGLDGFDWAWLRGQREIVISLDADDSGRAAAEKMRQEALYRGYKASILDPGVYGAEKDASAAWAASTLSLPGVSRPGGHDDLRQRVLSLGEAPAEHLRRGWDAYKRTAEWLATFHLDACLAAGWTQRELFALPTNRAGLDGGVCWTLATFRLQSIEAHADQLVAVTVEGSRMVQGHLDPPGPLPWAG